MKTIVQVLANWVFLFYALSTSAPRLFAQGGLPLWTNRFESGDSARSIAVDGSGNVFVTGFASDGGPISQGATIAYSNEGVPLWTNYFPRPSQFDVGSAVDKSGNVFVTGSGGTFKYSNTGMPLWTNGGSTGLIALDSAGNVFVSFYFDTYAYSHSGVPLWTYSYIGPGGSDAASTIAVDGAGNVILTGSATVKYSNSGVPLWTNRSAAGAAMAVDSIGNVVVTGFESTTKYSSEGLPLWTNRYNGAVPSAIALDSRNNVFVTAAYSGSFVTIAYSNSGSLLWTRRYKEPGSDHGEPSAIVLDSAGNVFVTGYSFYLDNTAEYATVAYSNSGVPSWTNRYNGSAYNQASAIAVDRIGNVFVTGKSGDVNGSNAGFVTIKYSSSVPPPRLDFKLLSGDLVLSWTNAGFNLQSAPTITGPFTNLPSATSPYTNSLAIPQQFFRLIGN